MLFMQNKETLVIFRNLLLIGYQNFKNYRKGENKMSMQEWADSNSKKRKKEKAEKKQQMKEEKNE